MSHFQIQKLILIKDEYKAAQALVDYTEQQESRLRWEQSFSKVEFSQVLQATASIEATYIVRLFSVFESILRNVLPLRTVSSPDRRNVYDLINHATCSRRILVAVRDEAQWVREFRNLTVHQNSGGVSSLVFADALAGLSRFLVWLP